MSNFLKDIIKDVGNEYATLVSDGTNWIKMAGN